MHRKQSNTTRVPITAINKTE